MKGGKKRRKKRKGKSQRGPQRDVPCSSSHSGADRYKPCEHSGLQRYEPLKPLPLQGA